MDRYVLLEYKVPDTGVVQIFESKLIGEDSKFVYLESGKYLKKYITAMSTRVETTDDDEEDEPVDTI